MITNTNELIERHRGQMWGDYPYFVHLDNVAEIAVETLIHYCDYFADVDTVKLAAYAHDAVEDTDLDPAELPESIRDSVVLVSRNLSQGNLTYNQYIQKIADSGDSLAILIKFSDGLTNYLLSENTLSPMRDRYMKSVPVLWAALCPDEDEWSFHDEVIGDLQDMFKLPVDASWDEI